MERRIKIALTGPESTGKSLLAKQLADFFKGNLVDEYSRVYYKAHLFQNTRKEIIEIAEGQIKAEIESNKHDATFTFFDSDLINIKIWLEYYNYEVPSFILSHIESETYNINLLLYPNTKWEKDSLRQNEHDRIELFERFKCNLDRYHHPYEIIDQLGKLRFQQSVELIQHKFKV